MKKNRDAKKIVKLLLVGMLFVNLVLQAQVGVNILTPHSSAAMQVESPAGSLKGMLTPSMSTSARYSISTNSNTTADGLIVYDTDHKMHYYFHAARSAWVAMAPLVMVNNPVNGSNFGGSRITTPNAPAIFSLGINTQLPAKELDVQGNASISDNLSVNGTITAAGGFSTTGFPINPFVPAGTIVMYHGANIPAGWAICNGQNGTPDLRGRFIVASGQATATPTSGDVNPNYVTNTKGGENLHTLIKSELPKHFHAVNTDGSTISANGGAHAHSVQPNGQTTGLNRLNGNLTGTAGDQASTKITTTETHSHPTTEFSGQVGNGASDGLNDQAHENRPQYYVLTFIMKL